VGHLYSPLNDSSQNQFNECGCPPLMMKSQIFSQRRLQQRSKQILKLNTIWVLKGYSSQLHFDLVYLTPCSRTVKHNYDYLITLMLIR